MTVRLKVLASLGMLASLLIVGFAVVAQGSPSSTDYEVAQTLYGANPACPAGRIIQVDRWEDVVARLERLGEVTRVPDAAGDWPHVDQYVVAPDDPSPFTDQVPDGSTFVLNCVPLSADDGDLVLVDGDGEAVGSFIPSSNLPVGGETS
jgi:hypothetical protein